MLIQPLGRFRRIKKVGVAVCSQDGMGVFMVLSGPCPELRQQNYKLAHLCISYRGLTRLDSIDIFKILGWCWYYMLTFYLEK